MMEKEDLIKHLIRTGALKSSLVISAFNLVDRKKFCAPKYKDLAYADRALPLFSGQTISQPTTVAIMTESLNLKPGEKVLEIGTGCGYQAAILAEIVGKEGKVFTMEIVPELFDFAKKNLKEYLNVVVIKGDGSQGLKKYAPFDGIIVTAGAPAIPEVLKKQLKMGGRLVIPVGDKISQKMVVIKRTESGFEKKEIGSFRFVPLTGEKGWKN